MKNQSLETRLWSKVTKTDGCWLWTGTKQKMGYGIIMSGGKGGGKRLTVTRIVYEMFYGDFDQALYVCHHCDNPACVRPDHLFIGTQTDNMRDCSKKGRIGGFKKGQTHAKRGPMSDAEKEAMSRRKGKPFRLKEPDGTIIDGFSLNKYCKLRGLSAGNMAQMLKGVYKQYKGYTRCED